MALLVLIRPERISELNGLAEAGAAAAQQLDAAWLTPLMAVLVMASAVGQFGGMGTAVSRLPFAAGVDHLLPAAFGKVHPRWATPYVSILVFGGVASFLLLIIQLGEPIEQRPSRLPGEGLHLSHPSRREGTRDQGAQLRVPFGVHVDHLRQLRHRDV